MEAVINSESVYLARGPGKGGQRLPKEGTLVEMAVIIVINHSLAWSKLFKIEWTDRKQKG